MKKLFSIIFCSLVFLTSHGQNSYSPYSSYGLGDIVRKGFGQSRSMGGISAGLRTYNQINYLNPASYTEQDTHSFMLDVGLAGYLTDYRSDEYHYTSRNLSFNSIALGFPVTRWWKSGIGLVPYSRVGYNILTTQQMIDLEVENYFLGQGGVNQFYLGNAIELFKKISIGCNINYLFGYIEQSQTVDFNNTSYHNLVVRDKKYIKDFTATTGIQYHDKLSSKYSYTAGISYDFRNRLYGLRSRFIESYINANNTRISDTMVNTDNESYTLDVPHSISAGFTLELKDKLTAGIDYSGQFWDQSSSPLFAAFTNSNTYHGGIEWIPEKYAFRSYYKRIRYRTGFYYSNTYLTIQNTQLNDQGFSFGLGFPFKFSQSLFGITYETGVRGTISNGLVRENYNLFSIHFTFYDFWFYRPKID